MIRDRRACVNKLTGDDNNSQDLTPSSLSISASSQTMVIDLAQRDQEDNPTPNCNIPDTIVHRVTPNTTDPIWTQRASRFVVEEGSKCHTPSQSTEKSLTKRQKAWFKPKPPQDFVTGHIARWLQHFTDKDEPNIDLAKLTKRNREGKSVWNVKQLCQNID
ncbi:hypothetical protein F444_09969, partial [Phytophthora nicotianae P1976]